MRRQSFRRLPVVRGDRQGPEDDADIVLWPSVMQATAEIAEIEAPQRDMKENRLQSLLVGFLQKLPSGRRALEVALVPAEQLAGLDDMTNEEERQEVGLVDNLVKPKRFCLVEPGPCEQVAHLGHDATRQVPGSC